MLRPSLPVLAATHLAVVALGYCLVTVTVHFRKEPEAPELRMRVARDRGKTERAGRHHVDSSDAERIRRGDALLTKVEEIAGQRGGTPEDVDERLRKLIELADKSPSSTDPAGEVKRLMEEGGDIPEDDVRLRFEVTCLHWLRADPGSALAAINQPSDPFSQYSPHYSRIAADLPIKAMVKERGWRGVFQYLPPEEQGWPLRNAIVQDLRREAGGPPYAGHRLEKMMEDFYRRAVETRNGEALDLLCSLGLGAVKWLDQRVTSGVLPPEMREALETNTGYLRSLSYTPGVPLERRRLEDERESSAPHELQIEQDRRFLSNDVRESLEGARDWKYAFRRSVVTAEEVLEAMRQASPELAQKHPEEMRNILFQELVRADPARALTLLDHLPQREKWQTLMRNNGGSGSPEGFLLHMERIPDEMATELWEDRCKAWKDRLSYNNPIPHEVTAEWLAELPAGRERDLAACQLLRVWKNPSPSHGKLRARLSASIRDPHVLEMMKTETESGGK